MPSDQNQGDYNPEYRGGEGKNAGVRDQIGMTDVNHPTSPGAVQSAESTAGNERFGRAGPPYFRGPSDLPPGETPPSDSAGGSNYQDEQEQAQTKGSSMVGRDAWLIAKAHEIYTTSTDYVDANITNIWETNLAHFNNEHAPQTNFRRTDWRRSRVFRPKTRAATKSAEAALTVAAFSTQDVVDIRAEDERDPLQRASAAINKQILQYRLDRRMPWYQTSIGAYQSTKVYGLCISFQYWRYEADTDYEPAFMDDGSLMTDDDGAPLGYEVPIVRKDELICDLIAPENFRFDPMCDWRDPCTTSPYLLYMMPVYAGEALERMEAVDVKTGMPLWKKHKLGSILATRRKNYDRTRQAREGRERIDPADEQHGNAYTMLWAHMNIVKINGTDYMYWTMGTELLLTDPVPLLEAFPHLEEGERPFVVGFSSIEAFRNYPAGDVEQSSGLQEEINTIANQRIDNIKLVLNKRYYVRRGSQVDLDALVRNVPGGGVMMNDPEKDVKTVNTPDVTQSSYMEQDKLAMEFDELVGNFAQGSAGVNREGNSPTVGGSAMMSQTAGSVSDYGLRIFFETWMEPVLRQLMKLEQAYENDETILSIAANQAQLLLKFGVHEVTDELIRQDLVVRVNVGMGNTDPIRRVERLLFGLEKAAALPQMAEKLKADEAANEIFGSLGYKDASRFFMNDQQLDEKMKEAGDQTPPEIKMKQQEIQIRQEDNKLRHQRELMKLDMEAQLGFARLALEKEMTLEKLYQTLGMQKQKMISDRQATAVSENTKIAQVVASGKGNGAAVGA
jgi:hypothetical protein